MDATAATRAIARDPEMNVEFVPEAAPPDGNTLRLAQPAANLPYEEVSRVRGHADSVALKRRHHDARLHQKLAPAAPESRAIFDALEQTRCECLGTRRMAGVAINLEAAVEAFRESLKRESTYLAPHVNLASTLGELERLDEAQEAAREVLRMSPKFSISEYMDGVSYRYPQDAQRVAEGLRKAGLPE